MSLLNALVSGMFRLLLCSSQNLSWSRDIFRPYFQSLCLGRVRFGVGNLSFCCRRLMKFKLCKICHTKWRLLIKLNWINVEVVYVNYFIISVNCVNSWTETFSYLQEMDTLSVTFRLLWVVSSCLDYCISLLYSITDWLMQRVQSVQNATARLVTGARWSDHLCGSASTLRSSGWSSSLWLAKPRSTLLTNAAWCQTLVVASCVLPTFRCARCHGHEIVSVTEVSLSPALVCGALSHQHSGKLMPLLTALSDF